MRGPQTPSEFAREAGLRYANDTRAGITRRRRGKAFAYLQAGGHALRDREALGRIKRLAIPPAWEKVWISPHENGHLQATGFDVRGRKQYRYHPHWREVRDQNKFGRMMAFGRVLPALRRQVARDLRRQGLPREKVLAAVVKLLETTLIRVGNEEYAKSNRSFGLTTMLDRHAKVSGGHITFEFRGKSGKSHKIGIHDPQLARIVKRCQDLPDQEIFAYLDGDGQWQDVKSQDVNSYLHEVTGDSFTAKDFRTWSGTVLAAIALREMSQFTTQKQAKGNIVKAIESVAKLLGNTPTICRKCYVHPEVLESYLEGSTIATLRQRSRKVDPSRLKDDEVEVMNLLKRRLKQSRTGGPTKAKDLADTLKASLKRGSGRKG